MKIHTHFDSGSVYGFQIQDQVVTFTLAPGQKVLNVLVDECPANLRVRLELEPGSHPETMVTEQGLLWGTDDKDLNCVPLQKEADGVWFADLAELPSSIHLLTRYPYGRNALDQLICDTRECSHLTYRLLTHRQRTLPMFELGHDDGARPVHYFIAGEDVWETAGSWAADRMVRLLCDDPQYGEGWLDRNLIRIFPLVSPYSAGTGAAASYLTLDGDSIYGAATWGDQVPPPEFALLRETVVSTIAERRLGALLTIHSWQGQSPKSSMETLRTSGDHEVTGSRLEWLQATLPRLVENVPSVEAWVADKIWYPGLARDYLLGEHNAISFRIEVTTVGASQKTFAALGEQLLHNFTSISGWRTLQ